MPNDLANLQEGRPSTMALSDRVNQSGFVNTNIGNVNIFQFSQHPSANRHGRKPPDIRLLDSELFHVIVCNEIDLADGTSTPFVIPFDCVLTAFTDNDLRERYATLEDDAPKKLKTFPALFAHEDDDFAHASFSQEFAIGAILDISQTSLGIKITPWIGNHFSQQDLDDLLKEFHLAGHVRFNELNRTHWSLKRGNLIETIREYFL